MERLGRPEDHAELLAHHYQQALELGRAGGAEDDPILVQHARDALRAAGERAFALSAYPAAAQFFADALAFSTSDDPARPRLLLERARVLLALGEAVPELFTETLQAFRVAGDIEGQAEAATLAARLSHQLGDRVATDRYIALALEATADRPRSRARAEALTAQTGFLMLGGRFEDAVRVGAEARPLVEALGLEEKRAHLHNYVGCARCCLGDEDGLAEIETSIEVGESAGAATVVVNGYGNLSSELYFFAKLAESRRASRKALELAERYGVGRLLRFYRADVACWAYADGQWDEALTVTNELLALAEAGDPHYSDAQLLALRGWIEFARGDTSAAEHDTRRAVELARGSDLLAQSDAYCIGGSVALAAGRRDEADELASGLAALGPPIVAALCAPFPTLADVALLFQGLGRSTEFIEVVLDPDPIKSPWNDAARAICDGEPARAADIIERIGHTASAAYARLRAAEALAAAGEQAEAAAQRGQAEAFYRPVGAIRFIGNGEELDARASVDG
jgi:tetratricopeptide (TPR) repeat protein